MRDDEALRRQREDAALDVEEAGRFWTVGGPRQDGSPVGDLPDNPPELPVGLWTRLLRSLRGR